MTRTFIGAGETLNPTGGVTRAIKGGGGRRGKGGGGLD